MFFIHDCFRALTLEPLLELGKEIGRAEAGVSVFRCLGEAVGEA